VFSFAHRLPRLGPVPRLAAAGVCILFALTSSLSDRRARAAADRRAAVVVAVRDLPAGHTLTRADLRVEQWPVTVRPGAARASPADLLGDQLAGPVGAREPITADRLLGRQLTAGLPQSVVASPVPVDDPQSVALVRPGDRIDVLALPRPADLPGSVAAPPVRADPGTDAVSTVVSGALVLAVLPATDAAPAQVVIAATRPVAVRIARDRSAEMFTALIDAP
jgi:pilus assembly protein CpaB